ncbi:tripartite tricarboxylate transporter substrate binding protein [Roseomonas xinghualingensis]|uniref:tripartite tricarboxylate transporter substrate binding protein n=1 Tax=Roseomonas xinghualingensis TaxID=2986475 RepID=UPI0021F1C5F3|nr:tripartite tricarboxylate transporter substrate binding protein [Roseomonas sp. SXEYE001]MCV4207915.1 tripartite tricarboxylate transporter substrate binding protein [Roseomonas sp. SXEYE001]
MTGFSRRVVLGGAVGLAGGLAAPALAQAGWRPSRPMRFIVPFAPGGSADMLSRMAAEAIGSRLGQPVVVENRAGAGGNIGTDALAKADPDGHAVGLVTVGTGAINYAIYRSMPYGPKDLAAISNICNVPNVIMVANRVPAKTLGELVELARQEEGKLNFGSAGIGTSLHLTGEMLKGGSGLDMTHIPFRGAAQMLLEAAAGRVEILVDNLPSALPQIKDGRVRALAVTDTRRSPSLPEVPTTVEAGFPHIEAVAWFGVVAPGQTPRPAVEAISAALQDAIREPGFRAKLAEQGSEPVGNTPAEFEAFIAAEIAKWGEVVRKAGVVLD